LPFRAKEVKAILSFHLIEHLARGDHFAAEIYRTLAPGGGVALGIPDWCVEFMFFHPRSGIGSLALGGVFLSQALIIETATSGDFGGLMVCLIMIAKINFLIDFFEVAGSALPPKRLESGTNRAARRTLVL
jgi:hypothetical protein